MTDREVPRLDTRRAAEFRGELVERARAWVPDWSIGDASGGFGAALLDLAARFNAQVAERLDRAGEKLSLGLLDWLALRGKAARPARMPVAFKLADTATEPVLAAHPVRLQADAGGATVVFETEADVKLVPGRLDLLVGVDSAGDKYFLPPCGLTSLDPLEPLPTQWRTRAFAQNGTAYVQLDPALGIAPGMLLEIGGRQYRVETVDGDLVKLDPPLDATAGIAPNTEVRKVEVFDPFGTAVRNQQRHYVYFGDDDLFNIEAAAELEIHGASGKLSDASWEYFGKAEGEDTAQWRPLTFGAVESQSTGKLTLHKPKGGVEPTQVGNGKPTRWIRASQEKVASADDILSTDSLTVVVNPGASKLDCPVNGTAVAPGPESTAEGFANTTPLTFTSAFYPLGREPKQFDTFYLASSDAFSKKGADVAICFEMSDPSANAFSVLREGLFANRVLASVGGDGALHLLKVDGATGAVSKFLDHAPLQPTLDGGSTVALEPRPRYRPPIWAANDNGTVPDALSVTLPFGSGLFGSLGMVYSNPFYVACAAGSSVWVWKEYPSFKAASHWIPFGDPPAPPDAKRIDGLVYLRDDGNVAGSMLFAVCDGELFSHSAVATNNKQNWGKVTLTGVPASPPADPFKLTAIAPIDKLDSQGRWHGSPTDGMVGIFSNSAQSLVYFVRVGGACAPLDDNLPAVKDTSPAAARIGTDVYVFWQRVSPAPLPAPVLLHATKVSPPGSATHVADLDTVPGADSPQAIAGGLLEIPPHGSVASVLASGTGSTGSWIVSWTPFLAASSGYFPTPLPAGVGPLGGGPTVLDHFVVVPGTQADAWSASWSPGQSREFDVTLKSGVVVPTSLTPAIERHDFVALETTGASLEHAEIGDLDNALAGERFHSLEPDGGLEVEFGVGAANAQLVLYRHESAPGLSGTRDSPKKMTLAVGDHDTAELEWLLVAVGTSYLKFRQVEAVDRSAPQWKVTFVADPALALPTGSLTYWRPQRILGRAAPYMTLDPNAAGAWDAKILDHVRLNFDDRDPSPQRAKAFTVTPAGRPMVVVLDEAWTAASDGNGLTTCSFDAAFGTWSRQLSENTTNPTLMWEYWDGRAWDELQIDGDDTQDFKLTGRLRFKVPATLAPTDVSGKTNHWIRARLIEGDYGREVVTVLTKPHPTIASATVQEVQRDSTNFHPPLVVNMRIRYSVSNAAIPTYLLTQDAGSLRDQSDANRTQGTIVEAFVPLSVQFRRFERAADETLPPPCPPECTCDGRTATATSDGETAAAAAKAAASSGAARPCILLGLDAGLVGGPINVLLLVEERPHDAFAPLSVEALVNDRFEPIAVRDTTRALGESGLLSMAFAVEPTPRNLFGRALTWLRLQPSRKSANADWKPVVRGAYLNAAWASATETLTRESLGSSDGRPHLTVQVARPPLLQDSLELRAREPLDDEERQTLLAQGATNVKFNEPDLQGDWVLWKQVPDPNDCEPHERVYSLDEQSGVIRFGDGLHGMIPPIGRDSIVAFSYQRTEPSADGSATVPANQVTSRTPLQLITPVESVEAAFAADRAAGGSPPEDDARVLRFGNARLRHRERAIALADFEDLALQSSPDIAQARAIRTSKGLRLVMVMRGPQPAPTASQRRELKRLLQGAASPLFGDRDAIAIDEPKVRRLRLYLALRVASLDVAGRVSDDAGTALARLFNAETGGFAKYGWPLGVGPSEEDIAFALAEVADMEGIDSIEMREIDAQGNEQPWREKLRADELVVLAEDPLRIRFEPLEFAA